MILPPSRGRARLAPRGRRCIVRDASRRCPSKNLFASIGPPAAGSVSARLVRARSAHALGWARTLTPLHLRIRRVDGPDGWRDESREGIAERTENICEYLKLYPYRSMRCMCIDRQPMLDQIFKDLSRIFCTNFSKDFLRN